MTLFFIFVLVLTLYHHHFHSVPPHHQVVEINDSVALLRKKLEEADDARSVLLQARKSLRQDIRFGTDDGDGHVGVGDGDVGVLLQARKSLRQDIRFVT